MNEIDEICKRLISEKHVSTFVGKSRRKFNNSTKSKFTLSNGTKELFDTTDCFPKLVPRTIIESDHAQVNGLSFNCQTEPLDLSQKQKDSIAKAYDPAMLLPKRMWKPKNFEFEIFFSTCIKRFTANDVCHARCQMLYKDHYHCYADNGLCTAVMKGKEKLRLHGKRHCIAEELSQTEFAFCLGCQSNVDKSHYHCSYSNCDFVSIDQSHMDRLCHVESVHCTIISKRTTNHDDMPKASVTKKRRRKSSIDDRLEIELGSGHTSQISSVSSDNQFIDFDPDSIINTINKNCIQIIDRLSPDKGRDIVATDTVNSEEIVEPERNYFQSGSCARLFCNLKKGDHYHCPICDRGSSKRDLYIRHLKQRHK